MVVYVNSNRILAIESEGSVLDPRESFIPKIWEPLKYFLGILMFGSKVDGCMSQRKHVIDILNLWLRLE